MRSIILLTTSLLFSAGCFAQEEQTTPATEAPEPAATFTLGAVYANNASYYGQRSVEKTPYAAAAATLRFKSGFYFTGLAYKLLNEKNATVSASSVGAGVNFKLFPKLSADLSYSHSFFPANSPLLQAGNADNASASLTYEGWLNVSVTGDYAFGKSKDQFVTAGLSKAINLFSISAKDIVTLTPSADVVAGTQRFYQTYLTEKKVRDSLLGSILDPIGGGQGTGQESYTVESTAFNLMSYNFKLPLAYNRSHYVLEAAYQLSVLSDNVKTTTGKTNSFVTLSFYYQF